MNNAILLALHLLSTLAKLIRPGGYRTVVAENLLLKQQLIILSRTRQRSPNLTTRDRTILGFLSLFLSPTRMLRAAIIIRPSTLLRFHTALVKRKYQQLYSPKGGRKPGPSGPAKETISAIVSMKQRNPRYGCPRIAQQINLAFGLNLDKDIVRRVLAAHYTPDPGNQGPSWLTTLGHAKDSLWSIDLFRTESIVLKSHWIMVVMDQYTRKIVGFSVVKGAVDGPALCRMFNEATAGQGPPSRISMDNDPLFQYRQWKANLRVLEIEETKSLPYVPMSHPFVERLIGSVRRELLDQTFFWTKADLEDKLRAYQHYFNAHRCHSSRNGTTPIESSGRRIADINGYHWEKYCRGLFQLPVAV
ncbi:MAG: integrase core domain-containing protein [Pseudomonadota bacterium]